MANIHHWTHSLPEGKRIFSTQVEAIDLKKMKVKNVCNELKNLQTEILDAELSLRDNALKQYSDDEIEKALEGYMDQFVSEVFGFQKEEKP
jgi:hypothetical protein